MNISDSKNEMEEYENESLPKIFKSWKQLYAVVIGELALLILLFYWFTKSFE
ncbi:hypothetical protein V6R21_18415 [Limibacter armeniacum]|uniref:hypothetical protein n=1 Tax=Limibacter armeniacum TaxID=466084 RepID=UPI002FE5268E